MFICFLFATSNPDDIVLFLRMICLLEPYYCRTKLRNKAYRREREVGGEVQIEKNVPLILRKESGNNLFIYFFEI